MVYYLLLGHGHQVPKMPLNQSDNVRADLHRHTTRSWQWQCHRLGSATP